ncbi:hypothetical protein LCGC14_0761880 [marine sediment metagenome]|uniref:Uncharacterized protein n=1 Tax=marine sediment metagenome TaxID=412755 RepID=A0A0F9QKN9_9ZZZZ
MKKTKSFFFLILFSFSSIILFPPTVHAVGDDVYLVSNDIIKNFKFDLFDGGPVSLSGQSNDRKLQFESQASWRIDPADLQLIDSFTQGDDAYIRYKVGMTSKINMITTVEIAQGAENNQLKRVTESFLVAKYKHIGLTGAQMMGWEANIDWTHYDFGDIRQWGYANNDFSGDLVMSFDIAQNPLPNFQTISGDSLTKNFGYIAVSSIAVIDNIYGLLDNSAPDIVGITPREYREEKAILGALDEFGYTRKWNEAYEPDIELYKHIDPLNSFDGGITPQSEGSSMNPRTKSGDPIWDPEMEQRSMRDAKFIYHIGSLSPIVTEYSATLSYKYMYYISADLWTIPASVGEYSSTTADKTYTKPIALHVTNRYIQTKIKVVFDVFTSYKIDVGADGIEDFDLDFPREYYDLLLWLTTVDGFGGGEQQTSPTWNLFADWNWIIILVVAIIGGILFIKIGMPIIRGRQRRKEIETIMRGSKRG